MKPSSYLGKVGVPQRLGWTLIILVACCLGNARAEDDITFKDRSASTGLTALAGPTFVSSWVDMDLDGVAEPTWFSQDSVHFLNMEDGEIVLNTVTFANDHPGLSPSPEIQMVLAVGDFSRNGKPDIVVFASTMRRYSVTAPGELTFVGEQDPPTPAGVRAFDAAVGDINGDGWPDIVLAMGRISTEHVYELGERDLVFMNRGGAFHPQALEPSRVAQSNGITLADVNGDRLLDVVESVDFSGASGPARILINQTPAGALEPLFVVADSTYDVASYGMGAAVEDVDQDGLVDIYNASTGQDFFMMQRADGSYEDRTWTAGITHEWGTDGGRIQWAPSLVDFDADGDVDVFVRHGHLTNMLLVNFGYVPVAQQHLVYAQGTDGQFHRQHVPFDTNASHGGVDAVVGDLDGDGLADITMGTQYLISSTPPGEGVPIFWHNETEIQPSQRPYHVVLKPTVSAFPPTGARVRGTCGESSITRHLTSGGRMGGMNPSSLHIGWKDCPDTVGFEVFWPSGVVSLHGVEETSGQITLQEPAWWTVSDDRKTVVLQADETSTSVCYSDTLSGPWTCCQEATCDVERPLENDARLYVRSGDSGPVMASAPAQGWLTLRMFPPVPVPNTTAMLRVTQHENAMDEAPWVRIDGEKFPWDVVDNENGRFEAFVEAPAIGASLDTTLFVSSKAQVTRALKSGHVVSEPPDDATIYPYQMASEQGAWRVLFAPGSSQSSSDELSLDTLVVVDQNGGFVPSKATVALLGRIQVEVPWKYVEPGARFTLTDGGRVLFESMPTFTFTNLDALRERVDRARGFLSRIYPVEGGDRVRAFFTLLDDEGYPLPPDPSLCVVEVLNGAPAGSVEVLPGGWDMSVVLHTLPGVGPGSVSIRTPTGTHLLTLPFTRRARADRPVNAELSSVSLSEDTLPAGVGATAELQIFVRNAFNELLGMDSDVNVTYPEALSVTKPLLGPMGFFTSTISPSYYGGVYPIEVWSQGILIGSTSIEVVGPQAPAPPVEVTRIEGDEDVLDTHVDIGPEPAEVDPSSGGCQLTSADDSRHMHGLLFVLACLFLYGFRRQSRLS